MSQSSPLSLGVFRGLAHRCPNCGQAKLYRAYLKVVDQCSVCAHPLGLYRADDGPAYITILLVGHLVIAPLLFFPFIWQWSAAVVLPMTLIPLSVLVLLLLPRIKGAFIGLLWSLRDGRSVSEAGAGPSAIDPGVDTV
jgi:uncharacterized protein (DUF983 family)